MLVINTSQTEPVSIGVPRAVERYTLTARTLQESHVQLNGQALALGNGDALPAMQGARAPAGDVALAPVSITFLSVADAGNASCR
jgi:hypothetical protein